MQEQMIRSGAVDKVVEKRSQAVIEQARREGASLFAKPNSPLAVTEEREEEGWRKKRRDPHRWNFQAKQKLKMSKAAVRASEGRER